MLHLLHPAFVHFSVAFLVFGSVTESWAIFAARERPERFGSTLVLLGMASLVLTILTGYLAANTVDLPPSAADLLWAHERNGWLVLGYFFATQFWKAWNRGTLPPGQRRLYAVLLLGGVALVAWSSWLGAEMVYGHGVGVGARLTAG